MPKYIIIKTERYEVEAENTRTAMNHFHIFFNDAYLSDFGMEELTIPQDNFDFLDGTYTIEEQK